MNLTEAYQTLDLGPDDVGMLKENYQWLVRTYHPDNKETGSQNEFKKIVMAYEMIRKYL